MPSVSSIEAGKAFLRLFVEDNEFRRGLDRSLRRLESFGRSVTSIGTKIGVLGTAITAPFVASLKLFADAGSELHDLSKRTGVSVKELSELKFAAQQSGASLGTIAIAIRNMQKAGFDPRTFDDVASEIAAIEDPTRRAQKAFEVFGKSAGSALLAMLDELPELRKRAHALGVTMDDEAARKADRLGDALGELRAAVGGLASGIGSALAPQVTALATKIAETTGAATRWVAKNNEVIVSVGKLGAGLVGTGGAVIAIGKFAEAVAHTTKAVQTLIGVIGKFPALTFWTAVAAAFYGIGLAIETANAAAKEFDDSLEGLMRNVTVKQIELQRTMRDLRGDDSELARMAVASAQHSLRLAERELAVMQEKLRLKKEFDRPQAPPTVSSWLESDTTAADVAFRLAMDSGELKRRPDLQELADQMRARFDNVERLKQQREEMRQRFRDRLQEVEGPIGTFSGALAPQIFGHNRESRAEQLQRKHLAFEQKQLMELQKINRRRAILIGSK